MTRPSQQELWAETAELAQRFGSPLDGVLDLEHHDRRRLLATSRPAGRSDSGHLVPVLSLEGER
jgi:hypothetical protein